MDLIPVLDLKGGQVVRARMGQRQNYQPINTPLAPSSDPLEVMHGLLGVHAFRTFYVADLDAIEGGADNRAVVRRLRRHGAVDLWIDNGIADLGAVRRWMAEDWGDLVIGSETQGDAALLQQVGGEACIVLSLDFRGEQFIGPSAIIEAAELWPPRVIVMSLGRVGSKAGPDLARLEQIQRAAGHRCSIYAAGGIRHLADLLMLQNAGVHGALIASCLHDRSVTAAEIGALQIAPPVTSWKARGLP
jgi:phosphoribosylformimino-5-aminoimidazole carboxamide ribotide isomerase